MALAEQVADLVVNTQRELGKPNFAQVAQDLQEHVAFSQLMTGERMDVSSGVQIQWNIKAKQATQARHTELYDTDNTSVQDTMTQAVVPWRHIDAHYAIDIREVAINRNPQQIVDQVISKRVDRTIALAALIEDRFWGQYSASDTKEFFPINYWLAYNATTGFNGGAPGGVSGSSVAGVDTAAYPNFKNFTAKYTNVSKNDLIQKWREAATKTGFNNVTPHPDINRAPRWGYFTNYDVISKLESVLESQNDNLGNDVASKDGMVTFRQVPVTWVPALDSATGDPIYGINFGTFKVEVLAGEFMRETVVKPDSNSDQHNVLKSFVDITMNTKMTDRRRNFLLATADPNV